MAQSDIVTATSTLTAANQATPAIQVEGDFLVLVKGSFSGVLALERRIVSSNDEADFLPVAISTTGEAVELSQRGAYAFHEPAVRGAEYRIVARTLTGAVEVSFDQ